MSLHAGTSVCFELDRHCNNVCAAASSLCSGRGIFRDNSFVGETLSNHSYVDLGQVGGAGSGSEVVCHTDLPTCCGGDGFDDRGHWYFPNGTQLPGALLNQGASLVERRRCTQQVDLQRGNGSGQIPSGIYRCDIQTNATKVDGDDGRETMYIGVYENGGE